MSDLAAILRQASLESGAIQPGEDDDHSYVGAEEITVVTDETSTELEEAVADTASEVEKLENSNAAAEKVAEAADSLESKLNQLRAMADNGQPLDHSGMRWYIQGLAESFEARDLPVELVKAEVEALQYSFESAQVEDYTTEAEEKTENILQRVWKVLVAALSSAKTAISQFFGSIGRSSGAIATGGKQLQRIGAKLKGAPKKDKIKTGGYGRLVDTGGIKAEASIEKAIKALDGDLTTHVLDPLKKALTPITAALKGGASAESVQDGNWAAKFAAMGLRNNVVNLNGGVKAELKIDGEKVGFSVSKPSGDGVSESAPLSPSEIVSLGAKLVTLSRVMNLAKAKADKFIDSAETVLNTATKTAKKDKTEGAKDRKEGVGKAVTTATRLIKAGQVVIPTYVNYLSQLGKEAYNFGKASAGAYGTKEAKAEGDDANKDDANKGN